MKNIDNPSFEGITVEEIRLITEWDLIAHAPVDLDYRYRLVDELRQVLPDHEIGLELQRAREKRLIADNEDSLQRSRSIYEEANDRGDLLVERVDGRIVSLVVLRKVKTLGENPYVSGEVYELARAFTVPEERGKGHYSRLRARAIEHAKLNHPNASLITSTNKEHIKKMNRKDGWHEIEFSEFCTIYGDEPKENPGWTAFYLSPNQNSHTRD